MPAKINSDGSQQHGRCLYARRRRFEQTDKFYWQHCDKCLGCRMERYETTIGASIAEAIMSACTISVTLTYAPIEVDGEKVDPDGAIRHDHRHWDQFIRSLRKRYNVRAIRAPEYGSKDGRAHFHGILYFGWSREKLQALQTDMFAESFLAKKLVPAAVQKHEFQTYDRQVTWQEFAPPLVYKSIPKSEFMEVLDDPEQLFCTVRSNKRWGRYRQKWWPWPHGVVEAQLLHCPDPSFEMSDENALQGAVRYAVRYSFEDPWKDSKEFRGMRFDELPEHIRQATKFGSKTQKQGYAPQFHKPNKYAKELQESLNKRYGRGEIPLHDRLMTTNATYKPHGGLGRDYWPVKGRIDALAGDKIVNRTYQLAGVFKKAKRSEAKKNAAKGKLQPFVGRKQFTFYMTRTAFRHYARGFNLGRISMGYALTHGPDYVFQTMEDDVQNQRDANSGPFLYRLWEKLAVSQRLQMEENLSYMSPADIHGLAPRRQIDYWIENSDLGQWPKQRRDRNRNRKYGAPVDVVQISGTDSVTRTKQGRFIFRRNLDVETIWWERELLTVEDMLNALDGSLLPENARAMRIENEGKLDQTPLSKWRPDKIRDRMKRLVKRKMADSIEKGEAPF